MDYPVDHARTTRQHAGETLKNTANIPGLIAVVVGVVALASACTSWPRATYASAWSRRFLQPAPALRAWAG